MRRTRTMAGTKTRHGRAAGRAPNRDLDALRRLDPHPLDAVSQSEPPRARHDVDEVEPDEDDLRAVEVIEEEASQAPDDTLGLYLRQMGSIPLLNRKQELDLAQRLETARKRYRHA